MQVRRGAAGRDNFPGMSTLRRGLHAGQSGGSLHGHGGRVVPDNAEAREETVVEGPFLYGLLAVSLITQLNRRVTARLT